MKRYLSHSLIALSSLTLVGLFIHISNGTSVAHANLHVATPIAPIAQLADSLRTVSFKLDDAITVLHARERSLRRNFTVPVKSSEVEELMRLTANKGKMALPPAEHDAFQLNNRIQQQEAYIRSLGELVERHREMYNSVPMLVPANGTLTSHFGVRVHPVSGEEKLHAGVDIGAKSGTPIYASGGGVVVFSGVQRGYGNVIEIDHGFGYRTLYGHASKLLVEVGDTIERGQLIALVGSSGISTGPHLHYEVIVDGTKIDPTPFLAQPLEEPAHMAAEATARTGRKSAFKHLASR